MKFGLRTPSLKKRFAARTSLKRIARNTLGLKVPRGFAFVTNPQKAIYNRVYNRTSFNVNKLFKVTKESSSHIVIAPKSQGWSFFKVIGFLFLLIFFFPFVLAYWGYKIYKSSKPSLLE